MHKFNKLINGFTNVGYNVVTQDILDKYKSNIFAKIHCDLIFAWAKIRFIKIYSNPISVKEKTKFTKTYYNATYHHNTDSIYCNPASISYIEVCNLSDICFNENKCENIYPVLFNSKLNKIEIATSSFKVRTKSKDDVHYFKCEIIFKCYMFIHTGLDKDGKRLSEFMEVKYVYDLLKDDGFTTLNMLLGLTWKRFLQ